MPLTVALALSGLEPEQWSGDLREIYNQGAALFTKEPFLKGGSSSTSSMASSACTSPSSGGVRSRYHSMESGINSMSPDFQSYPYSVNGKHQWEYFLSGDLDLEDKSAQLPDLLAIEEPPPPPKPIAKPASPVIMYQGRDILDLGSHLAGSWAARHANIPAGVDGFFMNRSQFSRLKGTFPPNRTEKTCYDCGFVEPILF